jgi:hypothetical protein
MGAATNAGLRARVTRVFSRSDARGGDEPRLECVASVCIPESHLEQAMDSLREAAHSLPLPRHLPAYPSGPMHRRRMDLIDALRRVHLQAKRALNDCGVRVHDITGTEREIEAICNALAPHALSGSYIQIKGGDHHWVISDGALVRRPGVHPDARALTSHDGPAGFGAA